MLLLKMDLSNLRLKSPPGDGAGAGMRVFHLGLHYERFFLHDTRHKLVNPLYIDGPFHCCMLNESIYHQRGVSRLLTRLDEVLEELLYYPPASASALALVAALAKSLMLKFFM